MTAFRRDHQIYVGLSYSAEDDAWDGEVILANHKEQPISDYAIFAMDLHEALTQVHKELKFLFEKAYMYRYLLGLEAPLIEGEKNSA